MMKTMCSNKDITMFEDFKNERFNKNKSCMEMLFFTSSNIF